MKLQLQIVQITSEIELENSNSTSGSQKNVQVEVFTREESNIAIRDGNWNIRVCVESSNLDVYRTDLSLTFRFPFRYRFPTRVYCC